MPRGRKVGEEQQAYPSKATLQESPIVPGGTVGRREELEEGIAATPSSRQPQMPRVSPSPDDVPNMTDPSGRADEAITAGLSIGAGPGPEALGFGSMEQSPEDILRSMYLKKPSRELSRLLQRSRLGWR